MAFRWVGARASTGFSRACSGGCGRHSRRLQQSRRLARRLGRESWPETGSRHSGRFRSRFRSVHRNAMRKTWLRRTHPRRPGRPATGGPEACGRASGRPILPRRRRSAATPSCSSPERFRAASRPFPAGCTNSGSRRFRAQTTAAGQSRTLLGDASCGGGAVPSQALERIQDTHPVSNWQIRGRDSPRKNMGRSEAHAGRRRIASLLARCQSDPGNGLSFGGAWDAGHVAAREGWNAESGACGEDRQCPRSDSTQPVSTALAVGLGRSPDGTQFSSGRLCGSPGRFRRAHGDSPS